MAAGSSTGTPLARAAATARIVIGWWWQPTHPAWWKNSVAVRSNRAVERCTAASGAGGRPAGAAVLDWAWPCPSSRLPYFAAQSRAVSPAWLFTLISAPAWTNRRNTAGSCFSDATDSISGVIPRMSRAFTSAPASTSVFTTAAGQYGAAIIKGVSLMSWMGPNFTVPPEVFAALTLAPFDNSSSTAGGLQFE